MNTNRSNINHYRQPQPVPVNMRTIHALAARLRAAVLILIALSVCAPAARAASAGPPDCMTYQGFLVDASGVALGNTAPKNYDVIFRLWNAQSGGDKLWTEQQTVTVDKGYFSVLLGEGSPYGSDPRPALSTLFRATPDVSDRFVEFTVKGIGANNTDVTILPRLRLLTAPYAFLAQNAVALVSGANPVVSTKMGYVGINTADPSAQLDVNGRIQATALTVIGPVTNTGPTVMGTATAAALNVTGTATAASFVGSGANLTDLDASKIGSGTLDGARIPATLTGDKIFPGNVSIGKATPPEASLDVAGTVRMFQAMVCLQSGWVPTPSGQSQSGGPYSSDGFLSVVVQLTDGGGNTVSQVKGFVDDRLCGAASVNWVIGQDYPIGCNSFMMPVPKGSTWKVTSWIGTFAGEPTIIINWTPLGR